MCGRWVLGGGGDVVFVDMDLELLSAGGSHQTQSFGVGLFPDLDGGGFVSGGRLDVDWSWIGLCAV